MTTAAAPADFQKKFKYHHGNLRDALLSAATHILETKGIDGLSLRGLAKATGVTQAAPYSHFRDKDELLAAVAETGFQRLALQMAEDATGAAGTRQRIEKLVSSYIRFAVNNKPMFQLMFGRELSNLKKYPTLAMTAGKSYALISAALSKRAAGEGRQDARFLTVAIWSLCHGLTTLIVEEKLDPAGFGAGSTSEFVEKTVEIFAAQLG
ncbi:MAG: TetR family transcriptional regulator [Alphaproteobacteria bacterium]|nr:TetR family transcriptional regulator [Alphaproteobacteria bacterium]